MVPCADLQKFRRSSTEAQAFTRALFQMEPVHCGEEKPPRLCGALPGFQRLMAKKVPQHIPHTRFQPEILSLQACAYTAEVLHYSAHHLCMGGIESSDDYDDY